MLRKVLKEKVFIVGEIPTGDVDGINVLFETEFTFEENSLKVYLNGLALREGLTKDYILVNSTSFEFIIPPENGDVVEVDYQKK